MNTKQRIMVDLQSRIHDSDTLAIVSGVLDHYFDRPTMQLFLEAEELATRPNIYFQDGLTITAIADLMCQASQQLQAYHFERLEE